MRSNFYKPFPRAMTGSAENTPNFFSLAACTGRKSKLEADKRVDKNKTNEKGGVEWSFKTKVTDVPRTTLSCK